MTKFKETDAFVDLETRVCMKIAGVIQARLKETGLSDETLRQISEDIGYDLVATIAEIGKYEVPGAEIYAAELQEMAKLIAVLESKVKEMAELEEKVEAKDKDMAMLESKVTIEMPDLKAKLEEKNSEISMLESKIKEMSAQTSIVARLKQKAKEITPSDTELDNDEDNEGKVVLKKDELQYQDEGLDKKVLSLDKFLSILKGSKSS